MVVVIMTQCHQILERGFCSEKVSLNGNEMQVDECKNSLKGVEFPMSEHSSSNSKNIPRIDLSLTDEHTPKIRITNVKQLDWAFNCVLLAIERTWIESYQLIINPKENKLLKDLPKIKVKKGSQEGEFPHEILLYGAKRLTEIQSILFAISLLFYPVDGSKLKKDIIKQKANKDPSRYLAASSLSFSGKQRLCMSLERILITLKHSIRFIKWFNEDNHDFRDTNNGCDLILVESVVCLLAWLCPKEGKVSHIDFVEGTNIWYMQEKISQSNLNSKSILKDNIVHKDDSNVLRIPKILYRTKELEISLQKLYISLKHKQRAPNGNTSVTKLNHIVKEVMKLPNRTRNDKTSSSKSLLNTIATHLGKIKLVNSKYQNTNFKSVDQNSYANNSAGNVNHPKRKRKITTQQKVQNKSSPCKSILCSRNKVVDNWLGLDEEFREGVQDDVFVDLDDFLVPG